jgi:hypothetical protein
MLTANRIKERLSYDPKTGVFVWATGRYMGKVAGHKDHYGYIMIRVDGKQYPAHRLAWLLTHGEWPPNQLDHRDRNRANNAMANLRPATHSQNGANKVVTKANGLPKGAIFHKVSGKYFALIRVNGKRLYLGQHDTAELAHSAYVLAAQKYHGEFARTE